ncbi:MAG TPA: tetratricopeptide repeat protein [Polyangiaceae bacterium]
MASALVPKLRAVPAAPRRSAVASLIGRDAALERVTGAIASGERIVTLTGPPGIGKTRLSLACLDGLAPRFARDGGSWFCDLSHVTTEAGLALAVLTLLRGRAGGDLAGADEARARVGEVLEAAGPTLLVLDNFEQIDFAAGTVERWCEAAADLRVIVTSRARLAVAGEIVIELAPLDEAAGAELFMKRARDAGGAQQDDAAAVGSIVRKLEGIPLAIELAAARTRIMSPSELDRRLASGHGVLAKAGLREGRHATLASAIAWSWELLSHEEQRALARCAVFVGAFALEVAEKVVGGRDALETLASLRDKSLLHAQGDGRLALYVSIRDFAAEKLRESNDEDDARAAHARTFGEMAHRFNAWRQMLDRAPDAAVHAALRRDKENLAAAVAYARAAPADLRADLAVAAAQLFAFPAETCIAELTGALASLGEDDAAHRGLVLVARQSVHASLGDYQSSLADLDALEHLPNVPRDLAHVARVYQGIQLRHYGFPEKAWEAHVRATEALAAADSPRVSAMNQACMGRLQFDLGNFEASRHYNENAIAAADVLHDSWLGALALANLAQLEQENQRFERAEELLSRALERLRDVGEMYEAIYTSACGDLYFEWGKHELARKWYAEGARHFRGSLVTPRHAALATAASAALEALDGDAARAASLIETAKRIARRSPNRVVDAAVELHAASVELLAGGDREKWRARLAEPGSVVLTSFEARFALRIARRTLASGKAAARVLRVDRQGRWFELDGARVDLGRRGALRRILVALATRPDAGIKHGELAAAGWPGERVLVEAAATRVRVAIATLRQLGLRALLVTRDDGYVLDGARIEWSD